ncbi:MAG: hypothetical protein JWR86_797 [Enterovirga sp.]|nr:hypothetical protein [Enterovirga sp.]
MVRDVSTLSCLALTAAALAHLAVPLPGAADPAKSFFAASARAEPTTPAAEAVAPLGVIPLGPLHAAARAPARPAADVPAAPTHRALPRVRVPVGCERVVSGLVRSAAAQQIARCVT